MYCKKLTKQMLQDQGIYEIYWDADNNEWWIDRYWTSNRGRKGVNPQKKHTHVKIVEVVCRHKYTHDVYYKAAGWSCNGKSYIYPLARILYAWFIGDIEDGMSVDHINNNKFDNRLDNLRLLTVKENLVKRYRDNPYNHVNQYK